jgi:hypothetical protein
VLLTCEKDPFLLPKELHVYKIADPLCSFLDLCDLLAYISLDLAKPWLDFLYGYLRDMRLGVHKN